MRILIVEPREPASAAIAEALIRHGHRLCGVARDPADARAIATRLRPDLAPDLAVVATRLAAPGDGIDLGFELMEQAIAVLFIADDPDEADIIGGRSPACGTGCLTRPYRPEHVPRAVDLLAELLLTQRLPERLVSGLSVYI